MASWRPPVDPLGPEDDGYDYQVWLAGEAGGYDPYAEQDKTPTERMYDEMNREERLDGLA